ncbi:hypothetical protein DN752_14635 [Echinicola strongylocentroti]|uniref:Uncharacterized protein n=1 Tax=Echinicola strongylocentroti TaxID=1795355 RepID=A0A2Z4IKN1_9BACT|nr:hypothetical protein [Echinicola strongylocentroti]AWW31260.1 hypothetical protein DN752_14635 [Echinicola strongylocentroti]
MKKRLNLPEHHPNQGSWEALTSKLDMESQLKRETENLPSIGPSKDIWPAITSELDRRRPAPWWWTAGAAVMAGIGLLLAINLLDATNEFHREYLVTTVSPWQTPSSIKLPEKPKPLPSKQLPKTVTSIAKTTVKRAPEQPVILEDNNLPLLQIPWLEEPYSASGSIAVSAETKTDQDTVKATPSFHEVTISWGINDRIKLKTDYETKTPQHQAKLHKVTEPSGKLVLRLSQEK